MPWCTITQSHSGHLLGCVLTWSTSDDDVPSHSATLRQCTATTRCSTQQPKQVCHTHHTWGFCALVPSSCVCRTEWQSGVHVVCTIHTCSSISILPFLYAHNSTLFMKDVRGSDTRLLKATTSQSNSRRPPINTLLFYFIFHTSLNTPCNML